MSNITEPRFTVGEVAQALGVPRATLRIWAQRGFIGVENEGGTWRKYTMLDIAQTIAVRKLAAHMSLRDAANVMSEVVSRQREFWERAVDEATSEVRNMWVFVTRFDDGTDPTVFFYAGNNPSGLEEMFDRDVRGGWVHDPNSKPQPVESSTARYSIGPAISAALRRLPKS